MNAHPPMEPNTNPEHAGLIAGAEQIVSGAIADASAIAGDSSNPLALLSKIQQIVAAAPTEAAGITVALQELETRIIALEAKIAS